MRHKLIRGYFDVDLDIIWNVAAVKLPDLIAWLDSLLGPPTGT
jgi:uncharacterized protein with HEPN domain